MVNDGISVCFQCSLQCAVNIRLYFHCVFCCLDERLYSSANLALPSPPDSNLPSLNTDSNTAIVIPQAPEDAPPTPSRRGRKPNLPAAVDALLPYKCDVCEYRARWPSEITQHKKNHSNEKPFRCPRCTYRSKWKWDVVKHLKRCGGGTVQDVIDETKLVRPFSLADLSTPEHAPQHKRELSSGPPNVTIKRTDVMPSNETAALSNGDDDVTGAEVACTLCPFRATSEVELEEHGAKVHAYSDSRPFACHTCGYASKWKNDLKKHCKLYAHRPATPLDDARLARSSGSDDTSAGGEDMEQEDDVSGEQVAGESGSGADSDCSFRCNMCAFVCGEFATFLQHKLLHSAMTSSQHASLSDVSRSGESAGSRRKQSKQNIMKNEATHAHLHATAMTSREQLLDEQAQLAAAVVGAAAQSSPSMSPVLSPVTGKPVYSEGKKTKRRLKRCGKCNYVTDNVTTLQRHLAKHGKQGRFTCPHCDYSVDKQHVIDYHVKRVHLQDERESSPVETDGASNSTVDLSERGSPDSERAMSDSGDVPATVRSDLFKIVHIGMRVVYACRKCAYTSAILGDIHEHVARHGALASFTCSYCDFSINDISQLRAHVEDVHDDVTVQSDADDVSEPTTKRTKRDATGSEADDGKPENTVHAAQRG